MEEELRAEAGVGSADLQRRFLQLQPPRLWQTLQMNLFQKASNNLTVVIVS